MKDQYVHFELYGVEYLFGLLSGTGTVTKQNTIFSSKSLSTSIDFSSLFCSVITLTFEH